MQHLELAGVRRSVLVALAIAFLIPVAVAVWALTLVGRIELEDAGREHEGRGGNDDSCQRGELPPDPAVQGLSLA